MIETGIERYMRKLKSGECSEQMIEDVTEHSRAVLKKYGVSSDDGLRINIGTAQAHDYFVLLDYEGIIIDADDVFAIGYMTDTKLESERKRDEQYTLCAFFTKDSYVPTFGTVYVEKVGLIDRLRKIRKQSFITDLKEICHHLSYPICEISGLERLLSAENGMREKYDKRFMLEQLSDATYQIGLFDSQKMSCQIGLVASRMLKEAKK